MSGQESLRVHAQGAHARKVFCKLCGSSLFGGTWPEGEEVSIRFGSFDDDPGIRPQYHTFVASKAVWDEILDELPQFAEGWQPS